MVRKDRESWEGTKYNVLLTKKILTKLAKVEEIGIYDLDKKFMFKFIKEVKT